MSTSLRPYRIATAALIISGCYSGSSSQDTDASSSSTGTATLDSTATSPTASTTQTTTASTSQSTTMSTTDTADTSTTATTNTTVADSSSSGGSESSSGGESTTGPEVAPCPYDAVVAPTGFDLEVVGEGLDSPLFVLGHPTEPDRLFVLEQPGTIRMIEPGTTTPVDPPIADLTEPVLTGSERGLLGLAFHPAFPDDPRIYVNYTADPDGRTRIEEYTLDPDNGYVADPDSARIILEIYQPEYNHNGGGIAFDPTGMLLIGMGDGGNSGNARNSGILLSKFLRIGVEPDGMMDDSPACDGCPSFGPFDYTIPADNPHVDDADYAPEIFAMGFRNPWRWSIDVEDGQVWVGDVGQGVWEEVDIVEPGRDYGWNSMEGKHCYADGSCDESAMPHQDNADGLVMPLFDLNHDDAGVCAIMGGAVYHSCQVPEWSGTYLFTDYCNSDLYGLAFDGTTVDEQGVVTTISGGVLGNGWNAWGDVYFTGQAGDGRVWRVVPTP